MAPNILLLVLDTVRRDALEPYGAPPGSTPAIGDLARRGYALPRAYSTASWTLPSHASIFTGLLPRQLGLGQAPNGSPQSARPELERVADRMLTSVLRDAGYATHGWSTNLWCSEHAGFDIGFDSFDYVHGGRTERINDLLGSGPRARLAWALEGIRSQADDGAAEARRRFVREIDRFAGRPTFWFVNLSECHSPYLPPRPWNDLGAAERLRTALEAKRYLNFEAICLYVAGHREISAEAFERMRHLYARSAAYMDLWIADVLRALERRGILDETLVIVTSDHGENFGEDGLITHGFSVDQRLIHVPLVMAGPGAIDRDELFSLARLPALIADAAGIERHPWSAPELPPGVAVAQYDPLGPRDHPRIVEFARKWDIDERGIDDLCARFTCATDGELKLVQRDEREFLYDLRADPAERSPLSAVAGGATAARADALRAALVSTAENEIAAAVPGAAGPGDASPEELAAIERQMKLLGYM